MDPRDARRALCGARPHERDLRAQSARQERSRCDLARNCRARSLIAESSWALLNGCARSPIPSASPPCGSWSWLCSWRVARESHSEFVPPTIDGSEAGGGSSGGFEIATPEGGDREHELQAAHVRGPEDRVRSRGRRLRRAHSRVWQVRSGPPMRWTGRALEVRVAVDRHRAARRRRARSSASSAGSPVTAAEAR